MGTPVHRPARQGAPSPPTADTPPPALAGRLRTIQITLVGLLVTLGASLGYWQLGRSADYIEKGRRQTLRYLIEPAPRGVIYDRENRILATNRPRISAVIDLRILRTEFADERESLLGESPRDSDTDERTTSAADQPQNVSTRARLRVVQRHLDRINAITGRQLRVDPARLARHLTHDRTAPYVMVEDLEHDEAARLGAALAVSDPVQLKPTLQRWYPHGRAAAHVLGRVRREMTTAPNGPDFRTINVMGTTGDFGIERHYNSILQGQVGHGLVRMDASGFPVHPPVAHQPAVPGGDVVSSLDLDLQLAAEAAMAETPGFPRGAAVAIAIQTGEVLVLASKPDFDLNAVSPVLATATKQQIDTEGGWLNRAVQGLYPPGSSFKIYTALAGLRRGSLRPDQEYRCDGYFEWNGRRFSCHHPAGHGVIGLRTGLAHSCNVLAYQVGIAAGPDALAEEARRFHFDAPTAVDLPFETQRMLVPDPAWKRADERGEWTTGDTLNLAIGQGFLRISPLQAACALASLARRETLTVPTLLHQPGRRPSGDRPPEPLGLADNDYRALIESLRAVTEIGIGRNAQVPGISLAGKSGTAQVMRQEGMMNVAWFVAFAPVDRPEIAVAVAMEGDQPNVEFAGGAHAAPIVSEIIGAYFDKRNSK